MKNTMLSELAEELQLTGHQEVVCSRHNEVMKMFCQSDQCCICSICAGEEHKHHTVVSAAVARTERQKEVETRQQKIHQQLCDKERDVQVLKIELEKTFESSAKAIENSEQIFAELVRLLEKRRSEVTQEIKSHVDKEVVRVTRLLNKLEQEIEDLKWKEAELGKLFVYQNDSQFLEHYLSVAQVNPSQRELPEVKTQPRCYFENVMATISKSRDKIKDILYDEMTTTETQMEVGLSPSQTEPSSRDELLQYAFRITLDPNTVNAQLSLSEDDRRATLMREEQTYPNHSDRFVRWRQVLSRESLSGRCYWEVEWRKKRVTVAVAYKDIARTGSMTDVAFGFNDKSWALECNTSSSYKFIHNAVKTRASGPWTSRIGVYLDYREGVLAFYSVSDTKMTLLHKVQTTFTQPLHAGLWFGGYQGSYAEFCELDIKN